MKGTVTVDGGTVDGGRVALVPDASDDLFTRDTVAGELRAAERRQARVRERTGAPTGAARTTSIPPGLPSRLARLRGDVRIPIGHEHPRDLSAGERRILAITLQTMDDPQVLLIDEPTRGLDPAARTAVAAALRAAADAGAAVLIATHDHDFAHGLGARILPMRDGVAPSSALQKPPPDRHLPLRPGRQVPDHGTTGHRPADRHSAAQEEPPPPDAAGRRARRPRRRKPAGPRSVLLAAARRGLPEDAAAALPYAALAIAPLAVVAIVVSLDGSVQLGTHGGVARCAGRGRFRGAGGEHRRRGRGGGLYPADPGRPGLRCPFRHAPGRRHHRPLQRPVGRHRAVDAVPDLRLRVGGRGAGLLPRRVRGKAELWMLCGYGIVASYLFGLLTNLWFWPFAVGAGTGISYVPGAPLGTNLSSFLLYSLVTSTAGWDTLRAVTTIIGIARGGAGHPRRVPAGEAGLQRRRAGGSGPTPPSPGTGFNSGSEEPAEKIGQDRPPW